MAGRPTARCAATLLAAPVLLFAAYLFAGLIGGALPRNAGWRPPQSGVTIWVESNGVHTGLVLPKVAAGVDWRGLFPPQHLADLRYGRWDHLSVGWGERTFYLETPTWWDVKSRTVLAAAVGSGDTLLHVDHVPTPATEPYVRPIVLRPAEYRRLAAYIRATLAQRPAHQRGYYGYDAFYTARGRYSWRRTCNAWTGDALAYAGVKVGRWTPLPNTVLWWF
jgi:uncharacterized protein (TIGR02117 family)